MKLKFRKNISTLHEIKMQRAKTEKIDLGERGGGRGGGWSLLYEKGGDARRDAQGCKSGILFSLIGCLGRTVANFSVQSLLKFHGKT